LNLNPAFDRHFNHGLDVNLFVIQPKKSVLSSRVSSISITTESVSLESPANSSRTADLLSRSRNHRKPKNP